jgi:hypothetical protein
VMTPREKTVIQKAIEWRRNLPGRSRDLKLTIELEQAIWDLIISCDACNYGGHLCPGCGADVPHGDTACSACDESAPVVAAEPAAVAVTPSPEREHLRTQLQEIGQGTLQEWMRIVDLTDAANIDFQTRVTWQDHQGACFVGERPLSSEYGAFRITVQVEDLDPVQSALETDERPMHFGDNERTLCGKFSGLVYAYTSAESDVTCPECLERLANSAPTAGLESEWLPLTMQHVRPGDWVRPAGNTDPAAEITITQRYWPPTDDARSWHVTDDGTRDRYAHMNDHVVQHGECAVELNDDGRIRFLPPEMEIEIFMAPAEHSAIEALGWENRA